MAWGAGAGEDYASCSRLIERVRRNEITDLILLPGKRFASKDLISLAEIFAANPHKNKCLSIQASGHAVSIEALRIFGAALSSSCLEHLAIGDSSMGDEGIQALVEGIQQGERAQGNTVCSLKHLDLSFKGIGWHGLVELGKVAEYLTSLEVLDLSRNPLGSSFDAAQELTFFFSNVKNLILNDCAMEIPSLQAILGHANCCRELHLSNNDQLQDGVFQAVSPIKLDTLVLSNCGLSSLSDIPSLPIQVLDVSVNRLTSASIEGVRRSLPQLLELNIALNPTLGAKGVSEIARLENLRTVDASECDCGIYGALALIKQSKQLASIRLFHNELADDGFKSIAETLREQADRRYTTIDVAANNADEFSVADLVEAAGPCVDCLVVGGNKSGPAVEEAVRQAQKHYPNFEVARDTPKGSSQDGVV